MLSATWVRSCFDLGASAVLGATVGLDASASLGASAGLEAIANFGASAAREATPAGSAAAKRALNIEDVIGGAVSVEACLAAGAGSAANASLTISVALGIATSELRIATWECFATGWS